MSSTTREHSRLEFPYLDGLRGLAALAVVFYHAYLSTGTIGSAKHWLPWLQPWIGWGYLGVPVFIVLSGYVLMLPVLTRFDRYRLPGGFRKYIWRRARRILPPYWASLVVFAGAILLVPALHTATGTQWDSKIPMTWKSFTTHLLLVHDFFPGHIGKINGPMWSVAVEWQIYFVMPLLLLPLWRFIGGFATTAVVLGATTWVGSVNAQPLMHPWFVGLFAVGMLAAQLTVRARDRALDLPAGTPAADGAGLPATKPGTTPATKPATPETTSADAPRTRSDPWRRWAWPAAALLSTVFVVLLFATERSFFQRQTWQSEVVTGLLAGVVLTWLGTRAVTGRHTWLARTLAWKPFVLAGLVSYSVYLFHSPLLAWGNLVLMRFGLTTKWTFLLMVVVVVPLTLAACVGFWWLVERNFLNRRQRNARAEVAASGPVPEVEVVGSEDAVPSR